MCANNNKSNGTQVKEAVSAWRQDWLFATAVGPPGTQCGPASLGLCTPSQTALGPVPAAAIANQAQSSFLRKEVEPGCGLSIPLNKDFSQFPPIY